MKLIERIRKWKRNKRTKKMSSKEFRAFFTDALARSYKDKNIYEEQLKTVKPSFLKELATKNNTTVDEVKKLFREGKISIFTNSFLEKVEKHKIKGVDVIEN